MAAKNSQVLLIENVLSNINEQINEQENTIKILKEESSNLKNTISTLKHECKTSFNEQERLEDVIDDLKKQNILLSEQLKSKEEQLSLNAKELETTKLQNEQFMDNMEKRIEEFKRQLEDKSSIIAELENINKELNVQIHTSQTHEKRAISKLQRKLEQEEFKSFINNEGSYDFSSSNRDTIDGKIETTSTRPILKLDKLENKLKSTQKQQNYSSETSSQTEEEILKKNLGF